MLRIKYIILQTSGFKIKKGNKYKEMNNVHHYPPIMHARADFISTSCLKAMKIKRERGGGMGRNHLSLT